MIWTCVTFKENVPNQEQIMEQKLEAKKYASKPFIENVKEFLNASPEVGKICIIQFFTWIGLMSLMIFFTQFVVHILYQIPNLANVPENIVKLYSQTQLEAQNFSSICFAFFNLICFIVAIPIAKMAEIRGNKNVHALSLLLMALAYLFMAFKPSTVTVFAAMGLAGIGWASTLALPFAMLSKYIKEGTEGSAMGIFNIFISAPQVLVCTLLAWFINSATYEMSGYTNNHWDYAFIFGACMLLLSAFITLSIKEEKNEK